MSTTLPNSHFGTLSIATDNVPDNVGTGRSGVALTGADTDNVPCGRQGKRADNVPDNVLAHYSLVEDVDYPPTATPPTLTANVAPANPGGEHFSIWLKEPGVPAPGFVTAWTDQPWPEFVPGCHYDIRQPSRLRPLCSPRKANEDREP